MLHRHPWVPAPLHGLGVSLSISRWHHCYLLAEVLQSGQQKSPAENISPCLPKRRDRLHPPGFGSLGTQSLVLQLLGSGLWGCRKAARWGSPRLGVVRATCRSEQPALGWGHFAVHICHSHAILLPSSRRAQTNPSTEIQIQAAALTWQRRRALRVCAAFSSSATEPNLRTPPLSRLRSPGLGDTAATPSSDGV